MDNIQQKNLSHPFSEQWQDSDIVFIVQDGEFHCHSLVLQLNSPVFAAMFKGGFKECKEKTVKLPGKEKESFLMFLTFMYPMSKKFECKDRATLVKMLKLSQEYQADCVKEHVIDIFMHKILPYYKKQSDVAGCIEDLSIAEVYGIEVMKPVCIEFIVSIESMGGKSTPNLTYNICSNQWESSSLQGDFIGYNELSKDSKYEIITRKVQNCKNSSDNPSWNVIRNLSAAPYK